jgi:methyl-accepting chemotaxis protein
MTEEIRTRKPGRSVFYDESESTEKKRETVEDIERDLDDNDDRQLQRLLSALKSVKKGDFSARLPPGRGIMGEISENFNEVMELKTGTYDEIGRISKSVGEEGRLAYRASLGAASGAWKTNIDSINSLINNLAQPTT